MRMRAENEELWKLLTPEVTEVGSRRSAVGSLQLTVGNWQSAIGSRQLAVGNANRPYTTPLPSSDFCLPSLFLKDANEENVRV